MQLNPIPLATIAMPHTSEDGAFNHNNRFERFLWSKHTLEEVRANHEREQAEAYAEQWVLEEAA